MFQHHGKVDSFSLCELVECRPEAVVACRLGRVTALVVSRRVQMNTLSELAAQLPNLPGYRRETIPKEASHRMNASPLAF